MNFIFHKPTLKSTGGKSIFETTSDKQKLYTWQILSEIVHKLATSEFGMEVSDFIELYIL
jgi:hypothetical protein